MFNEDEIGLYIHYPFCLSKCPYCDFNSHVRDKINDSNFSKAYITELEYFKKKLKNKKISSIFFGGGTPSLMSIEIIDNLLNYLAKEFSLTNDIEITLEANPSSIEIEKFQAFKNSGINRISIGIQSFDQEELKFLGRNHNSFEAIKALEIASKIFDNFSFDLIYALPNQSLFKLEQQLKMIDNFANTHISCYQLTIEKGTKFYSQFKDNKFALPEEKLSEEMFLLVKNFLAEKNYQQYEVSNFAYNGFECKHNLNYWHYNDYLGIGPGAHSRINKQAIIMLHSPEKWIENITNNGIAIQKLDNLSFKESIEEFTMMNLRLNKGLNKQHFYLKFKQNFDDYFNKIKLHSLVKEDLIKNDNQQVIVTQKGQLILNKITEFLLA